MLRVQIPRVGLRMHEPGRDEPRDCYLPDRVRLDPGGGDLGLQHPATGPGPPRPPALRSSPVHPDAETIAARPEAEGGDPRRPGTIRDAPHEPLKRPALTT